MRRSRSLPLVSVLATCFNHERYVTDCLEGIRAQTYRNIELVVVDDASTDGSVRLIRDWSRRTNTPCTLVVHKENQGVCRTRNDALSHARGEYLSGISADDVWLPHKVALQVEQMEELPPSVGMAYGDAARMDEEGNLLEETFLEQIGSVNRSPEGNLYEMLLTRNFIPAGSTLVRRDCFETVGPYDESLAYEDWDMWLRIARRYEVAFTPGIGVRYRVHPDSLSHLLNNHNGGTVWWETEMAIYLKHIGYSQAWDAVLWDRIARAAYRLDKPQRLEYARANLRAGRSPKALALYCLCLLGVPYRRIERLKHAVNALAGRYPGRFGGSTTATTP